MIDLNVKTSSQKQLIVRKFINTFNSEGRLGWIDTRGRINLVDQDQLVRRFWRKPKQYFTYGLYAFLSDVDPWHWNEFLAWAVDPFNQEFPERKRRSTYNGLVRKAYDDEVIYEFKERHTKRTVIGFVSGGNFFCPHIADQDQWWRADAFVLWPAKRLVCISGFLEAGRDRELLELMRGLPTTLDEIRAGNMVYSL